MTSALQAGSEESASWWSSSVSEVKTLERLIDQKLSKAVQLTGGMLPDRLNRVGSNREHPSASSAARLSEDFSAATASAPSGSAPTTKAAAAASAAAAVFTVTAAMDVSVLREEVGRLASQVQNLEGQLALQVQNLERQPSLLAAHEQLEAKVEDLRRTISFVKEQLQSSMRERQLEVMRQRRQASSPEADSSSSAMAAMRQELDDLRARMAQLSKQVEIQGAATADELATAEPRQLQRPDVLGLRQELFSELSTAVSNVRREISKELRETAMEAAEKAAGEAAKEAGKDAAKEDALRATNETAREVLTEMVDKGTRPLKELTELLGAVREDVEKKQAAMHSEFRILQRDLQAELSAAVAAMSKEVTTSCSEATRSTACCHEDVQRRHSELMSMMNSHTTRFSKLRKQVEAMQKDLSKAMPKDFEVVEADGSEPTKVQLCSTVTTLQQQLTELCLKLQQVEAAISLAGAAQNTLKCGDVGGMADEASQRQQEVEAQVQWLRTEAANTEPIIQSLKAECEELRSSLRQGLQRLATASVEPTGGKDPTLQFFSMASVLAEEFDKVHTKKLGEMAHALGEEFDVAYQESSKAQLDYADEFRQKIGQLASSVQQLEKFGAKPEMQVQRLAQELGDEFENVHTPRTNADFVRLNGTSPFEPICKRALSAVSDAPMQIDGASKLALLLSHELEKAGLIGSGSDPTSFKLVQDKLAELPREVEKLRSDNDAKLAALAEALGEEFDHNLSEKFERDHAERTMVAIEPIQSSLAEMQQNHDRLAAIVQDLQQQRDVACQEISPEIANADIGSQLCVTEVETLIDANTEFVEELQRNFSNLSNVVEDLLRRQISLASELETVRRENEDRPPLLSIVSASPQGSLQCSPGLNAGTSQESTSDSKRELLGKRSPGLLSDAPSTLQQSLIVTESPAVSNVVSDLDCELSKAGGSNWDRLRSNLPLAMDGFRQEQDVKLTAMAEALGEEFEHIHRDALTVNHLSELALVMGEEFDKAHAEKHEPLEGHVLELQLGHERLATLMQAMMERQEYNNKHTVFLDDFKPQQFDNVSSPVWKLLECPNVTSAELGTLQQKLIGLDQTLSLNQVAIQSRAESELQPTGDSRLPSKLNVDSLSVLPDSLQSATSDVPATLQQQALMLSKFVKDLRSELGKSGQTGVASDVINMMGCCPADLEALRQEQTAKLSAMAEALGEEFEHMHTANLTDMAITLGEDFDQLHEEKHQVLQSSLVELQQNQAKLAAIVLRQEYVASLTEYTGAGSAGSAEEITKPRAEFETLCCYVRSEIDQKLQALREQLSHEVLQTLEAPRAKANGLREHLAESWTAAHCSHEAHFDQLFRITQEQGALLDDMRQQHTDPQTESPIRAFLRRSEERTPDEAIMDDAVAQVKVALFAGASCASAIESLAEMAPNSRAGATAQERALAALQLPKLRQQAALQQVMDNELCRARLALEGMPTFGALDANGCDTEPWDADDQPDDADGVPLSGRWFAAPLPPVPPGLRAQASEAGSEDVAPAAQLSASTTPASATNALVSAPTTAPAAAAAAATAPAAADVSATVVAPVSAA